MAANLYRRSSNIFILIQRSDGQQHLTSKLAALPLSTTHLQCLDQKWRRQNKLTTNPNACGILTDGPDYTYLDGRPTPVGSRMKKRLEKQQQYAETIVKLTKEMDFAVERYNRLMQAKEEEKQRIIGSKLKPKGHLLLKRK